MSGDALDEFVARGMSAQAAANGAIPRLTTRPLHMTPLELRFAGLKLGVHAQEIEGPAVGAIIGEAPGPNTSPKLPVFPFPASSAGGRLLTYSGMKPADYLSRFWRKNLFTLYLKGWCAPAARELASYIEREIGERGISRALLLGGRVGAAFGVGGLWSSMKTSGGITYLVVPHPSGRCRVYNDESARRRARAAIRWAAGLRGRMP